MKNKRKHVKKIDKLLLIIVFFFLLLLQCYFFQIIKEQKF